MTATKLSLYQGALVLLGERKLTALTDNVESRRTLDQIWDNNAQDYCLSNGLWNFAIRTVSIDADPDYTPTFGYANAFTKPSDWLITNGVSSDEYFTNPENSYADEAGFIFSDSDTLYLSYVSNHADYGGNLSLWTTAFRRYFEAYLAFEAAERITASENKKDGLYKLMAKRLIEAKSQDARNQPAAFPPRGSWSKARSGAGNNSERRGS